MHRMGWILGDRMVYVAVSLLTFGFCIWHQEESMISPKFQDRNAEFIPTESSAPVRRKRYTINPMGFKWDHLNLTYKIVQFPNTLNKEDTAKAVEIAFRMWSRVSPLTFQRVHPPQSSDLTIGFYTFNHSDCWVSPLHPCFDGLNGELAHAFLPPSGEIHFDNHEFWVLGPSRFSWKQGVWYNDLVQVAAHEIGHALGLWHSSDVSALMHPNATYTRTRHLALDDIRAIRHLYNFTQNASVSHKVKVMTHYVSSGQSVTFSCKPKMTQPNQKISPSAPFHAAPQDSRLELLQPLESPLLTLSTKAALKLHWTGLKARWYKDGSRFQFSAPDLDMSSPGNLIVQANTRTQGRYTCVIRQGRVILGGKSWNLRVT